jgi:hypothetical protein
MNWQRVPGSHALDILADRTRIGVNENAGQSRLRNGR